MDPYSVNPISKENEPASRMASAVAGAAELDRRFEVDGRIEKEIEGTSIVHQPRGEGPDPAVKAHPMPTDPRADQLADRRYDGAEGPCEGASPRQSPAAANTRDGLPTTTSSSVEHSDIVDWDGPDDPENPLNWSPARKWTTIVLVSAITFNVSVSPPAPADHADPPSPSAMASTIFATGVPQAMAEFGVDSPAIASLLISVFVIGLAVGPLVFSPLSEAYGRRPVMLVSNAGFLVATALCAVSVNLPMLIVFRLMMGLACCIPVTLGGGFVADLMPLEQRGTALSMWAVGPWLVGTAHGDVEPRVADVA